MPYISDEDYQRYMSMMGGGPQVGARDRGLRALGQAPGQPPGPPQGQMWGTQGPQMSQEQAAAWSAFNSGQGQAPAQRHPSTLSPAYQETVRRAQQMLGGSATYNPTTNSWSASDPSAFTRAWQSAANSVERQNGATHLGVRDQSTPAGFDPSWNQQYQQPAAFDITGGRRMLGAAPSQPQGQVTPASGMLDAYRLQNQTAQRQADFRGVA